MIKTGKEIGTTNCLGCKDYTHNFKPQEVKMTNKVLREKSNCVICRSKKSKLKKNTKNNYTATQIANFCKKCKPDKRQKQFSQILKCCTV